MYVTEAQKTSDRLYEFYHNRYYYKTVRNIISFPSFLNLDNKDFNRVKTETKHIDRNLVRLVKQSSFESSHHGTRCSTEPSLNRTVSFDMKALTETADHSADMYSNIIYEFSKREDTEEVDME